MRRLAYFYVLFSVVFLTLYLFHSVHGIPQQSEHHLHMGSRGSLDRDLSVHVPFALRKIYTETTKDSARQTKKTLPFASNTIIGLTSKVTEADDGLRFVVPELLKSDQLIRAELHIFRRSLSLDIQTGRAERQPQRISRIQLRLYQRLTDGILHTLVGLQHIWSKQSGWIIIPLHLTLMESNQTKLEFQIVERWPHKGTIIAAKDISLGEPNKPYLLLYLQQKSFRSVFGLPDKYLADLDKQQRQQQNFSFFRRPMMMHSNSTLQPSQTEQTFSLKVRRVRRNAQYRTHGIFPQRFSPSAQHHRRVCSLRSMIVDFAEIGWDQWIISPTRYDARMCAGPCPFPLGQTFHPSNHAVVQMLVHHLNPTAANQVHRPCCVPKILSPLYVLFQNQENHVMLKVYEDMIVESCACR